MISQTQKSQFCLDSTKWKSDTQEFEFVKWDLYKKKLIKVKIQVTITQENYIIYSQDGVKLRKELIQDNQMTLEMFKNIEQIYHLHWIGEYGQPKEKQGKWIATWNGEVLSQVGGQSKIIEKKLYYTRNSFQFIFSIKIYTQFQLFIIILLMFFPFLSKYIQLDYLLLFTECFQIFINYFMQFIKIYQ